METDFSITGKLARFGRGGMIQDVANRLLRGFAANLRADLAADAPEAVAIPEAVATPEAAATPEAVATERGAAPEAVAGATVGAGGRSTAEAACSPPRRPAREPAEPVGGLGLVLGAMTPRLKAAVPPLLAGLVLGVIAARRLR